MNRPRKAGQLVAAMELWRRYVQKRHHRGALTEKVAGHAGAFVETDV